MAKLVKKVTVVETVAYEVKVEGETEEELRAKAVQAVVDGGDNVGYIGVTARVATVR